MTPLKLDLGNRCGGEFYNRLSGHLVIRTDEEGRIWDKFRSGMLLGHLVNVLMKHAWRR